MAMNPGWGIVGSFIDIDREPRCQRGENAKRLRSLFASTRPW